MFFIFQIYLGTKVGLIKGSPNSTNILVVVLCMYVSIDISIVVTYRSLPNN